MMNLLINKLSRLSQSSVLSTYKDIKASYRMHIGN